jgi:tRNA nucleotidyltransferase (CCA-adding enzyme)
VARRAPLTGGPLVASARRRLGSRSLVRATLAVSRVTGEPVFLTGGAVRDAFLAALEPARPTASRRDLDLAVAAGRALPFAEALARRLGSRAVAIGAPPRRILHISLSLGSIDVWERESDVGHDLFRRDFTVNALAFELPTWRFLAPAASLGDLARRRLAPTRSGVLLEDPLRVLRAARFLAELPGFRLAPGAFPELRRAARRLETVAAERRLAELDRILSANPRDAARALKYLERVGALSSLLRGTTARERLRGIAFVGRLTRASPDVARSLLLLPLGPRKALETLRKWKTTRREQQLAARLLALDESLKGRGRRDRPGRREVVEALRSVAPFFEESVLFLSCLPGARPVRLASALAATSGDPRRRARLLRPPRPLDAVAALRELGVREGPRLGVLLGELDVALAAGEIRGRAAARRFLAGRAKTVPR